MTDDPELPRPPKHRRNRSLIRLGLCAAGGLAVGGLLALPLSGGDPSDTGAEAAGPIASVTVSTADVASATMPASLDGTATVAVATTVASTITTTLDPPMDSPTTVGVATSAVGTGLPTIPGVEAPAYVLIDADSGKVLAGSNADQQLAVGSLMKMLTAYVVMQAGDPDRIVTIPRLDVIEDESIIGLVKGMRYERAVLLRAMLVVSAGDAAEALAIDVAGSEAAFVEQMNQAAAGLGLTNTVAGNETGLDADGAHSSAADVAELARVLMQDPTFRDTVDNRSAKLVGKTFPSTNQSFFVNYPGASGVKTGRTSQAGYCLAASATRDGRSLIAVVLGTPSSAARTQQAELVLDWGFTLAT
ncbi:MAG: D-alanyl-D-alanine carboxypeptidase family protein [Ilumatobacteraceae bacterium]